ncbi:MAG: hypothetical protein ACQER4_06060, partial [Bacteroidota bacterium]
LKKRIKDLLSTALQDNRLAWNMHPDGRYTQRSPENGLERNVHQTLMDEARERTARSFPE